MIGWAMAHLAHPINPALFHMHAIFKVHTSNHISTYGYTWLGEPVRLVRPWPDKYLDSYSFTCIMYPACSLHGCKESDQSVKSLTNRLMLPPALFVIFAI